MAAILGICLPAAVIMAIVAIFYRQHGDHPWATAGLKGVAAAALGLILFTVVQLSKKSLVTGLETATLLILRQYKMNPALLVVGGGILGILSFLPK